MYDSFLSPCLSVSVVFFKRMSMDYFTINAQRKLIQDTFAGKKVDTIRLYEKHTVFLGFDSQYGLKLAGTPGMPYLISLDKHFIPVRKARDWHLPKFSGSKLDSIELTPGDRILTFLFSSGFRIIYEMTGRYANIIVVNPDGIVSGATRVITGKVSGFREIRPGIEYAPPPQRDAYDLIWGAQPVLTRRLKAQPEKLCEALAVSVCAGSRLFAGEAVNRSGLDRELTPGDLSYDETVLLLKTMASLAGRIEKGGEGGTVVMDRDGLPVDVFPLPMESDDDGGRYFENLNEAIRSYSRDREYGLELRQLRQSIASALTREEKRIRSTIKKVERDCGGENESELLNQKGNIILANIHRITKGMTSVVLQNLYGDGDIKIELNPIIDGPGNAERMFTRSRKIKAASERALERVETLRIRSEDIQADRARFESIDDIKTLRKIAVKYERERVAGGATDTDRPFPRRFESSSGLEIIVGRNDGENDELVRWARKNDIWLHAQGVGGSHVVLRPPGKQNPDHKSLELAAAIAAYYSKAKTSAVVPVVWTRIKYVTKRKGQGPGKVHYTREKLLFVEPGLPKGGK